MHLIYIINYATNCPEAKICFPVKTFLCKYIVALYTNKADKMAKSLSEHDKAVLNCVFNPSLPLEEAYTATCDQDLQGKQRILNNYLSIIYL